MKANEFSLIPWRPVWLPEIFEQGRRGSFRGIPFCTFGAFFLFFLKENGMLEDFALQAVNFLSATKVILLFKGNIKQGGSDYAEIYGKNYTGKTR
ncbi:MAG: hypothetical protein WGN25_16415 [Candidatus Electrothrix sp. GW3-4]|uniref:hypothetical protein n=1 Tax=Candidatus Electrothrix sp. GW3-4 TaxID=3126740 RepID=UPI0030CD2AB7